MASPSGTLVLVTGGSGFLGSWCIVSLLKEGYQVRTTVRSLSKSTAVKTALKNSDDITDSSLERLSFVAAELLSDENWDKAVEGCTYVLHVASPFPATQPKNEDDLIVPARDGTLRVLRAAKAAGVKRVVLTSSYAAIGYGHAPSKSPFTEESWTDITSPSVTPYGKSKTIAERAAWDFVKSPEGQGLELSVINPVGILGPLLSDNYATSIILIVRLLKGDLPGCPNFMFGVVDVRDVAALHLLAMRSPAAAGERFLASSPPHIWVRDIARVLKERLPEHSKKTSVRRLPDFILRFVALFDGEVASIVPILGKVENSSNEKAKRVLGWNPRSREDAIAATGESVVKLGLLSK